MARTLLHQEVDTIPSPIGQVWAILQGFGAIKGWMPTIDSCDVEGEGIGAIRTVLLGGQTFKERLEIYDPEKHTVSYRLLEAAGLPMEGGYGTVTLEPNGDSTKITWSADAEKVDEEGVQLIGGIFGPFIKSCIGGLKDVLARPGKPMF